jgi:hypothetical protein
MPYLAPGATLIVPLLPPLAGADVLAAGLELAASPPVTAAPADWVPADWVPAVAVDAEARLAGTEETSEPVSSST